MKKKIIIGIIILTIIITLILIFTYKFMKNGNNNINKSEEEIIGKILNMNSYKAKLEVEIETNKNKTKYVLTQSVNNEKSIQEVIEPSNIAGVVTEYDGSNLKITNKQLELSNIFENYSYIVENSLWLNSFIEEYKNSENKNTTTKNEEIILKISNEKEKKYSAHKELYINKETGKPTKMIVQDINKKILIYILYSEIEIS